MKKAKKAKKPGTRKTAPSSSEPQGIPGPDRRLVGEGERPYNSAVLRALPLVSMILSILLLLAPVVSAQESVQPSEHRIWAEDGAEGEDLWAYDRPDLRLVADFSFFTGSQAVRGMDTDYFGMGFVIDGHVRIYEDLYLDAAWAFAHGSFTVPSDTFPIGGGSTRVGNPYLGASYFIDARPVRLAFGLGVTLPVSSTPEISDPMDLDNVAGSVADVLVARMEGNVRPWLYLPSALSIVGKGRIESVGPFLLAADLAVAPMIAIDDAGVYGGETEFVLVPAAEIGWRAYPWLSLGVRGQVAAFPTEPDETLGSLEPFLEASKKNIGHFRLGFLLQLGGPNGSTFDDEGLWALRLTTGILF